MLFPDYEKSGVIYHIVSITDLEKTLTEGISYDDKATYKTKYYGFHHLIDGEKPEYIPDWVNRSKTIFASMNFHRLHKFHSHSAILAVKINEERCWIANENFANQLYEPFILQNIKQFSNCWNYLQTEGRELLSEYWKTSLSFSDNLSRRVDRIRGYDAEVLVCHNIEPENIEVLYIISDHKMMDVSQWKQRFCVLRK